MRGWRVKNFLRKKKKWLKSATTPSSNSTTKVSVLNFNNISCVLKKPQNTLLLNKKRPSNVSKTIFVNLSKQGKIKNR